MIKKMWGKYKRRRTEDIEDNKGFTLVELIVVLVILAILAAILVPALLGYIDRAKQSKYLVEASNIYKAMQAINSELYSQGKEHVSAPTFNYPEYKKKMYELTTPTELIGFTDPNAAIGYRKGGDLSDQKTVDDKHKYYEIIRLYKMKFRSQDGNEVVMTFEDGEWKVDEIL